MEEKYFLDEKGVETLGSFLRSYYVNKDTHSKDYVELDKKVNYLESPKVLPDNTEITDIKTDGLYIVNVATMKDSPVVREFSDYNAEQYFGKGWNGEDSWKFPPYCSPYMLLKVMHKGDDILYLLFDTIFDMTHFAIYNSKKDTFRWQAKDMGDSLKSNIHTLLDNMFCSNLSISHIANDKYIDTLQLSSPYIQQAEFHYNPDNITTNVTVNYEAGKVWQKEQEDEGIFLLGATENSAGVMSASDKKKLDSIDANDITSSIKSNQIVNDLNTGGTDKVLSAEQGKVINADIDLLSKQLKLLGDEFLVQRFDDSTIRFNDMVLSGKYVVQLYGVDDFPIDELLRTVPFVSHPFLGLLLVYRENKSKYSINSPVKIVQKLFDFNNRTVFVRKTSEFKSEYNQNRMQRDYSSGVDNWFEQLQQIQWEDWAISTNESQPFSLVSANIAGFMTPEDKKKLDSINIEDYKTQNQDIKSMKEEIVLLKSQIQKLQASVNNKE